MVDVDVVVDFIDLDVVDMDVDVVDVGVDIIDVDVEGVYVGVDAADGESMSQVCPERLQGETNSPVDSQTRWNCPLL